MASGNMKDMQSLLYRILSLSIDGVFLENSSKTVSARVSADMLKATMLSTSDAFFITILPFA